MLSLGWCLLWHISKWREYPGIHRKLRELKEEGKLTSEQWQKRRNERLRSLLIFAGSHVPYYRNLFAQVDFNPEVAELPNDLERVPLLTKEVVRKHLNELIAENANRSQLFENATGGSTGVPLKFYQDLEYQTTAEAVDAYVRGWWGVRPYDRTASIWGADREFHELSIKERLYEIRQRARSLNAFRMSDESLLEFCQMVTHWRPPYLMGYSSALEALAQCAKNHGINNFSFKAIRSTAETLWPHQRVLIEEALNGPVFNFYGSREVNNIAAECPEEKNLHLISTWRYIEIVDDKGNQVPDGQTRYIAVTDLSNYAMPFIRYRNEDMARMAKGICQCGRPSPVIEELLGRSTDIIRTARGNIVHGEYFTHLFYGRNDIQQFQVHQTALDRIVVRYIPDGEPPVEYMNEVAEKIRTRLGDSVVVEIRECKEIPIPPSGKHRFTISDVKEADLTNLNY